MAGYGQLPEIDEKFIFHAVRGRKTAEALGIDESLAITDSAILIRTVDIPKANKKSFKFGYMPHHDSIEIFDWESICRKLDIHYVCPTWDVEQVLMEITKCDTLLCEAMHGAIVADSLRIPWVPVFCYEHIDSFKWEDWLQTVKLPYKPNFITSIYDVDRNFNYKTLVKNKIKRALINLGIFSDNWDKPPKPKSSVEEIEKAISEFANLKNAKTYLSNIKICEKLTHDYVNLVEKFKIDYLGK